jgi:hypothetical protein
MTVLIVLILVLAVFMLMYFSVIRPWHLHWGATKDELMLSLPGDSLVEDPDFNATRGISIHAKPEEIWKWIIQIGSKRAGWYSIDWMDNAGIRSSDSILSEFQRIEVGQFIPFTPDQKNGMWVKEFRESEYILWVDKEGKGTWLWYIYQSDNGPSRLITRLRTKYVWKGFWIIYYLLYDFGDIIMMSKCLKGIRKRAERSSKPDLQLEQR